jgi:hypothetical protein
MFKLTGSSGRRNAGTGGVAQASGRIVSPNNKFRQTAQPPPHIAFQDPPGYPTHSFDSNTPRIDETA